MNTVLDVLKLRRVRLNYTSPAICPFSGFSSSGSGTIMSVFGPAAPVGLVFGGQCNKFLTWAPYLSAFCVSLYQEQPDTTYKSIVECLPPGVISVESPGWWRVVTTNADGSERVTGQTVKATGTQRVEVFIPTDSGAVGYHLYKNSDPTNQNGDFDVVYTSSDLTGAFEIIDLTGCYKLQAITDDGASTLSDPACRIQVSGCCPAEDCPAAYRWDPFLCSCVPDAFSGLTGPTLQGCKEVAYSSSISGINATGPCLWELVSGAVPTGLTLGLGLIAGTSTTLSGTISSGGNFTFEVRCTDFYGSVKTATYTIFVPAIDQSALPGGTTDTSYSEQLTVTGGIAPYTFAVTTGTLPANLSMSSSGLITGILKFSGSHSFGVTVTDSAGRSCQSTLSLAVVSCPQTPTYPTIAAFGGVNLLYGGLDRTRRIWYLPESRNLLVGSMNKVYLIDTSSSGPGTPGVIGLATDSGHVVNTNGKADWGSSFGTVVIDTKYGNCLIGGNQGFITGISLATHNAVFCEVTNKWDGGFDTDQWLQPQMPYDPVRGYVYMTTQLSGSNLSVALYDCKPSVHDEINSFHIAGRHGGEAAYCPDNDTLYIADNDGLAGKLFHKFNLTPAFSSSVPTGGTFTLDQSPTGYAGTAHGRGMKYIPAAINHPAYLMVSTSDSKTIFFDPNNGDALVATVSLGDGNKWGWFESNYCTGLVYVNSNSIGGAFSINAGSGFATASIEIAGTFSAMACDYEADRLAMTNPSDGAIKTYA